MRHAAGGHYVVREATAEELTDLNTLTVALAEEPGGGGQILVFEVALSFDEQDAELGMDIYAVCNEMGATVYGGVISCALAGNVLTIQFAPEAAAELDVESECRLLLQLPPGQIPRLVAALRRVLGTGSNPVSITE